jgi:hypothetical protein
MKILLKILYGIDIVGFIYSINVAINIMSKYDMSKTFLLYMLIVSIPIGLFGCNVVTTTRMFFNWED